MYRANGVSASGVSYCQSLLKETDPLELAAQADN